MINQGLMKLQLSPPLALNWFHWGHGRKARLCYQMMWQEAQDGTDVGKHGSFSSRWEMLESPTSHTATRRGDTASVLSGQETGLIAKLKITEFLPVHLSLDAGGLNKCGQTGLRVKWKDVTCPRLQAWGGFAALKSIHLISTSSLVNLVWDHHHRGIFSFGQMHIDHFQKWILSYRTDIHHLSIVPCSSQRSHTVLGTTQTNRLRGKQAA